MKKTIYKIFISIVIIALGSFLIIEGLIFIEGNKMATEKVDYVIVLGARLDGDVPSLALLERLKVAKDYLIENKDVKVVVTGGQGIDKYIPEAQAMEKYLINNRIENNRIIVDLDFNNLNQ